MIDQSDLNYFIYHKDYPIHSHASIIVAGGAGSGKTYYTFRVLIPLYIKSGIRNILIASKTGGLDFTSSTLLHNPIFKNVYIKNVSMEESFVECERIRAETLVNSILVEVKNIKTNDDFLRIRSSVEDRISSLSKYTNIVKRLRELLNQLIKLSSLSIVQIRDYASLMFKRGSRKLYDPTLVVYDDYAGSSDFLRDSSPIHSLIYCRRHLHATMIMLTQSITAISTNIRRNTTIFVCFPTLSEMDIKLLRDRLPLKWDGKRLLKAFYDIGDEEDRNDRVLTIFTVYPNSKIVLGSPLCIKHLLS